MNTKATTSGSGARHLFNFLVENGLSLEDIEQRSGIKRADSEKAGRGARPAPAPPSVAARRALPV